MAFSYRSLVWLGRLLALLVLIVALSGLIRFAAWSTGSQALHADVVRGPDPFIWNEPHEAFGGLSALLMSPDGTHLLAASDRGHYVSAQVQRSADGRITGLKEAKLTQVSLASGVPPTNFKMDVEALTRLPNGSIVQAFEAFVRIEILDDVGGRPTPTHRWDRFVALFGNRAFEALATLPDGRVMAITEAPVAEGLAGSLIYDGDRWRDGPSLPIEDGFEITGADVGPDRCLYLVERRYRLVSGFTSRLRRVSGGADGWQNTVLYTTPPAALGNVEGVSTWRDTDGRVVVDLITDDGFLPLTATRLIELRLTPGTEDCTLSF